LETTKFLSSINECQVTLYNLSLALSEETKELMIYEHNSIINEDSKFSDRIVDGISMLLKKITEVIRMIRDWINNKLRRFSKFMRSQIHNAIVRYAKKKISTLNKVTSDIDFELMIAIDLTTHSSYTRLLSDYKRLTKVRRKEEFDILKQRMDEYIRDLKTFYEESVEKASVEKSYNGGEVQKLLGFLQEGYRTINNIEQASNDLKNGMSAIKEQIEGLKEEDFVYVLGTYSIHVHTELFNINGMMLAKLAQTTSKINKVIVALAEK
jgi:hypothetical protein